MRVSYHASKIVSRLFSWYFHTTIAPMNEHFQRAGTFLHGALTFVLKGLGELWVWANENKKYSIPLALLILAGVGALAFFANQAGPALETDSRREVELVSVADVSSGEPITVIGEIRSVSEASVAPDASGRVTHVYRSIGDYVAAGSVIAEIENASQRAAVAQAEASLDRAKSGSALSGISVGSATAAAESARQSAYASIGSAVTVKADASFSNPNGIQPIFFISIPNSQLKNTLESQRLQIGVIIKRHAAVRTATLSESELISELQTVSDEAETVREFLANLLTALSSGISTGSITEATIAANEAEVNAALATISALQGSLGSASAGLRSARESLTQGRSGESADVALAQASLDAAKAALEKTIIRAPISGTINSITLETGNFAAAGSPAVEIVNASGLEAVAYLSERDLPRITPGSSVRISGIADGRVSRVAPALDSATRKAEVRIAIIRTDQGSRFVAGQSATIELTPVRRQGETALFIPIASVKITPDGAIVFIVVPKADEPEAGTLVSVPVTIGALSGGKVEIISGLALDNTIVADARGLKEGQEVLVKRR